MSLLKNILLAVNPGITVVDDGSHGGTKRGRIKTRRNAIAFSLIMLTIDNIKKLIAKDKTRTLELKKTTGELYKGMETACAFLNSDRGW